MTCTYYYVGIGLYLFLGGSCFNFVFKRIDDKLEVKIADFRLSCDLDEADYYTIGVKAKLPIKWMAPESMEHRVYNTKTDVVSFL